MIGLDVTMKKTLILCLMILLLGACTSTMPEVPDAVKYGHYPEVVQKVVEMQIMVSAVANPDIEVVSYERVVWVDTCLELGQPNESCLKQDVPGWLVVLNKNGREIIVHADDEAQMRVE
jgi:hypothetical protein